MKSIYFDWLWNELNYLIAASKVFSDDRNSLNEAQMRLESQGYWKDNGDTQ